MKRYVLLVFIMIPMLCLAQSIKVKYSVYSKQRKEQINKIMSNAANQEHKGLFASIEAEKEDSFCLVIKDRLSSYVRIESEDDLSDDSGPQIILVGGDYSEEERAVYKNMVSRTMTEAKDLLAETYIVETAIPTYDWKVSSDSKEIMGLKCYQATLNDTITAWFCPEIPVSDGPDVYAGLPGLILDLEDEHNIYRCIAIDTKSRSEVAAKRRGKKVSPERFEELRKEMLDM